MSRTLFKKTIYDLRWPLFWVGLLLAADMVLWAKVAEMITGQLMPLLQDLIRDAQITEERGQRMMKRLMEGPVEIVEALLGGRFIDLTRPSNTLAMGYIHPFVIMVLCLWAIGRAGGALAGETDRGTMELLLAQPIRRRNVVLTHLMVDLLVIPILCLWLVLGTRIGTLIFGPRDIDLWEFFGAAGNAAALAFAVSGVTVALSAAGRSRWKVMGLSLGIFLVMFLINLFGQIWRSVLGPVRPLTVFYYYQPQPIILNGDWSVPIYRDWPWLGSGMVVPVVPVLLLVGLAGYLLALRTFTRRDLPAPL